MSPGYVARLADVAARAASTELLVATDGSGGPVIGAVALATRGGPYADVAAVDEAAFRMLAVVPAAQGMGAGTAAAPAHKIIWCVAPATRRCFGGATHQMILVVRCGRSRRRGPR